MEVTETVPVFCMCRLCLKYCGNFTEIGGDESNLEVHSQIKKYLCIEVNVRVAHKSISIENYHAVFYHHR